MRNDHAYTKAQAKQGKQPKKLTEERTPGDDDKNQSHQQAFEFGA